MKTKCLLLFLAALISAPLISFIATAYTASFFPEGTFRKIETPAIGLSKGSGTASGIGQSGSEKSLLPNEPITFVGKNAQVYVNNLAWLEAFLNIVGCGVEIFLVLTGSIYGFFKWRKAKTLNDGTFRLPVAIVTVGLVTPPGLAILVNLASLLGLFSWK